MNRITFFIIFMFSIPLYLFGDGISDSIPYIITPHILSTWDGGLHGKENYSLHFQNISGTCFVLGAQYGNKLEIGFSKLIADDSGFTGVAKYNFRINNQLVVSPSVLFLQERAFSTRQFGILKTESLKINPGLSLRADFPTITLKLSAYKLPSTTSKFENVEEFSSITFYDTDIRNHLILLQAMFFRDKSIFHLNVANYIADPRTSIFNATSADVSSFEFTMTYSYQLSARVSLDGSAWARLNNRKTRCDTICINYAPRIGVSILLF